jgi:hypothetical protein
LPSHGVAQVLSVDLRLLSPSCGTAVLVVSAMATKVSSVRSLASRGSVVASAATVATAATSRMALRRDRRTEIDPYRIEDRCDLTGKHSMITVRRTPA